MPAADALALHTAIREQWDNEKFRTYVDQYNESIITENSITDPDWAVAFTSDRLRRALDMAETFYISPNMHEVVRLAAEDFPRDEAVMRDDQPSDAGFLYLPTPLRADDPRGGAQLIRAMLWINNRIWLFGDILDPDDWSHQELREHGVVPQDAATQIGRYQVCGLTVFRYGEPIPTSGANNEPVLTVRYLLAAWRLMQQSLSDVTREVSSIPRPVRRRAARKHLAQAVTVIELRRTESAHGDGTGYQINYRTVVRGHWRRVWCGPMDKPDERYRRAVYIHPTIRGPEGAPLIVRDRVHALMR